MLRLKKSACQFPAEYQFRMILVLTFLLVLLCSCQASLAKQQGPQEQVSCCNGELHEPAYSSHTSLFFSQCSQVRIFWQCCDLHAVLMPHRGETWKLNLPNEEEKTFHIDTQPSKCTGICHFFCLASHAACHILRLHSFYFLQHIRRKETHYAFQIILLQQSLHILQCT